MILSEPDLLQAVDELVALDPDLLPVRDAAGIVPLRKIDSGFAGLALVITGQQISTFAAAAIFARLQEVLGSSVDPRALLAASDADLRGVGQSAAKWRSLRAAAAAMVAGELDLVALTELPAEDAIAELVKLPGIGRWTAESYLLFALGHRDVFPAADIALQEAARAAFGLDRRPSAKELLARAEAWRPLRAVAARLLWAYYATARSSRLSIPKAS